MFVFFMFLLIVLSALYLNNRIVDAIEQSRKEKIIREVRAEIIRRRKIDELYGRDERKP